MQRERPPQSQDVQGNFGGFLESRLVPLIIYDESWEKNNRFVSWTETLEIGEGVQESTKYGAICSILKCSPKKDVPACASETLKLVTRVIRSKMNSMDNKSGFPLLSREIHLRPPLGQGEGTV